ncbi:dTMP kinase [Rhizobium leguminosarum]|uniref:dTMP kinase n=1 Tax=Rhizobium leguminosarum TaxID=384 RepID=UPI001F38620E|nr:deoxynucleoside kinase [Rhizobium leguminosarum]UIJ83180.1 deoxynucleoside kinase [Rhizobium leguminosarum]
MKVSLTPHRHSGLLIVFCGMDGSGKSTGIKTARRFLEQELGRTVVASTQPSDWWRNDERVQHTLMKKEVGQYADELALGVFAVADRLNQQVLLIEPALRRGDVVLMDRYIFSMLSYYMAENNSAEKRYDLGYLAALSQPLIQPDIAILMDAEPETLVRRVLLRDGRVDGRYDQDVQRAGQIAAAFRELAFANGIHIVSTNDSLEQSNNEIVKLLSREVKL